MCVCVFGSLVQTHTSSCHPSMSDVDPDVVRMSLDRLLLQARTLSTVSMVFLILLLDGINTQITANNLSHSQGDSTQTPKLRRTPQDERTFGSVIQSQGVSV